MLTNSSQVGQIFDTEIKPTTLVVGGVCLDDCATEAPIIFNIYFVPDLPSPGTPAYVEFWKTQTMKQRR